MTWVLTELSSHPDVQARLRAELHDRCGDKDVGYDTLFNTNSETGLPYLDAVVKETLRLHAPITENTQQVTRTLFTSISS